MGHVKLHGALYNMAARDAALANAIVAALAAEASERGQPWTLVALAGSLLVSVAAGRGLKVVGEAFADRTYRRDGTLTPRSEKGSVIEDAEAAAWQAVQIARERRVTSREGADVLIDAGTLCLHGDSPSAVAFALRVRGSLAGAGIAVRPF